MTAPVPSEGPAVAGDPSENYLSGDDFARSLMFEHAPPIRKYVTALLSGDVERTEDIVQETLLRAWQHRQALASHASPRPWLFRVARNLSVDWHRRRAARPVEVTADIIGDGDLIALDRTENVLRRRVLIDVLKSLSAENRDVLMHLYYYGRTQAEAAEMLGIAQGTVKSRAHYALAEMRQVLIAQGILRAT